MVASMFMVILITVGMILSFKLRSWGTLDFSSKSVILGELLILRFKAVSSIRGEVFSVFFRIVYTQEPSSARYMVAVQPVFPEAFNSSFMSLLISITTLKVQYY